jgi:transcriptional regulator with XRE-family HTH domain/mannose-6-phosphate isomerase-like protein (cupin superfamily)
MTDDHDRTSSGPDRDLVALGAAVKRARGDVGWSLRRLAETAGVSASLISAVENARIVPTVGSLMAISDALNVPAAAFLPARHQRLAPEDRTAEAAQAPAREAVAGVAIPGGAVQPNASPPRSENAHQETAGTVSASGTGPDRPADAGTNGSTVPDARQPNGQSRRLKVSGDLRRRAAARRGVGVPPVGRSRPSTERNGGSATVVPSVLKPAGGSAPDLNDTRQLGSGDEASALARDTSLPGVTVHRQAPPRTLRVAGGGRWELVSRAPQRTTLRLNLGPGEWASPVATVSVADVSLRVTEGAATLEVAFDDLTLAAGDDARVAAGVPHRVGGGGSGASILVTIHGEWDGRV